MDLEKELACVIFDEIHYINDNERGKIWEETILMLPKHVLIVMLSATINKAEKFAQWIEDIKERTVWLASTGHRPVPLTHFSYITLRNKLSEKYGQNNSLIDNNLNKLITLRAPNQHFQDTNFHTISKIKYFFDKTKIYVSPKFVLNNITNHLFEHNLLPAICFVFSRRKTEEFAKSISNSLNDSKTMNIIRSECKQILVSKLPNWKEYIQLPEFDQLTRLLEKGIGVHHSGIIPVFKEIIEIMFEKGYVKLLFATETFAVGVNMPTKTVIFTGLKKFDGRNFRYLLPHEYTQMAGRAGRRGLDKKGTVIHLNNMFQTPTYPQYRTILCGNSQTIVSKFKISFNLIMNLIANKEPDFNSFIKKSMMKISIDKERLHIKNHIKILEDKIQSKTQLLQYCKTPNPNLLTYANYITEIKYANRKKRKKIFKNMQIYKTEYGNIETEVQQIIEIEKIQQELFKLEKELENNTNYIRETISIIQSILIDFNFATCNIISEAPSLGNISLTKKGEMAANIQEVNCMVFGDLLHNKRLNYFSPTQLATIFSCFANIPIPRDQRLPNAFNLNLSEDVKNILITIQEFHNEIYDIQNQYNLEYNENEMQYNLCELIYKWCSCTDETQCKTIFQTAREKGISVGVFIKAILKINNIAAEFEKISQDNLELLEKLKQIPHMTLKSVVTNQSLYV